MTVAIQVGITQLTQKIQKKKNKTDFNILVCEQNSTQYY